ncbi:unnamed protein product [Notodromas monacha]|uniref:Armadillo repeat-containing protein 2 n=1 Tax=Notodromas monacha TaxID=399045 RepID=A0A7R9GBI4_9CRUS|nr:unnamed protein product [Notodromas monacha]CAG0916397.1 unnamed protein product [Notodromas monacha]
MAQGRRDADYAMDIVSQRKWSSEIINEARNAMRAIDTRRPFTPQANSRTLFGSSFRNHNGRPPSQFSLRSLDLADSRPVSGIFRLQPLQGVHTAQTVSSFPHRFVPKLPVLDLNSSGSFRRTSRRSSLGNLAEETGSTEEEIIDLDLVNGRKAFSGPRERTPHFPGLNVGNSSYAGMPIGNVEKKLPKRHERNRTSSGSTAVLHPPSVPKKQQISEQPGDFLETKLRPLVESIEKSGSSAAQICRQIYVLLNDEGYFENTGNRKRRTPVVKMLSGLVDHEDPHFLLHLARILLALRLRGNNLTNVWKLVFKIARCDKNDAYFLEDSAVDLIVTSIGSLDPVEEAEACVYAYGAVKFLTTNPSLLPHLTKAGLLPLMVLHVRLIAAERQALTPCREQMGQVLYQLTAGFRNVVGGTAKEVASSGVMQHLVTVAELFSRDVDIVSNMSRIFSVLAADESCCDAMTSPDLASKFLPTYSQFLSKYPGRQDVVVRIAYVLGNLMAKSNVARASYFDIPGSADSLLDLLAIYIRKDVASATPQAQNDEDFVGGDGSSGTPTDVIIKVIRVLANMSIDEKVGVALGGNHRCIDHLLAVVRHKEVAFGPELETIGRREDTEAVLSALAAMNNLAFYCAGIEDSAVYQRSTEITEFFDFLIGVLDSDNREAVYSACGVLVNMMTDPASRTVLKDLNGMNRLTQVLKHLGAGDWQLASLVVQVLWNACAGLEYPADYIGEEEADELMDVLEDHLEAKETGAAYYADFCVVADQFLDRLDGDESVEE